MTELHCRSKKDQVHCRFLFPPRDPGRNTVSMKPNSPQRPCAACGDTQLRVDQCRQQTINLGESANLPIPKTNTTDTIVSMKFLRHCLKTRLMEQIFVSVPKTD